MARTTHDHARYGVFDLCRIVSNYFFLFAQRSLEQVSPGNMNQEA